MAFFVDFSLYKYYKCFDIDTNKNTQKNVTKKGKKRIQINFWKFIFAGKKDTHILNI